MKPIILVLGILLLVGCNSDDDSPIFLIQNDNNEIYRSWKLIKFEAGFGPTLLYDGEITWTFALDNMIHVVIENGTEVYSSLPLNLSGNYTFSMAENSVEFDNVGYGYVITEDELIIWDAVGQAADGRKLTFSLLD